MKAMRRKSKRYVAAVCSICIASCITIGTLIGLIGLAGNLKNRAYAQSFEPVPTRYEAPYQDENGNWKMVADGDFRILQITDVHFGGGAFSITQDKKTVYDIERLVRATQPDLIVSTGDMSFPFLYASGTADNMAGHKLYGELMQTLGVPWAVVLGNHDAEDLAIYDRKHVAEYYASCGGSIFQSGNVYGYGNYTLDIVRPDGSTLQKLIFMDSNSYMSDSHSIENYFVYDAIHEDQMDWYEQQVKGADGKSMLFFHIPLFEFDTAWELWKQTGDSDIVRYVGGERGEGVCHASYDNGFFDRIAALGHTQAIFCGHDHYNTAMVEYRGILLAYGMALDRIAYPGIGWKDSQRGANLITVQADGGYTVEQIAASQVR